MNYRDNWLRLLSVWGEVMKHIPNGFYQLSDHPPEWKY